MMVWSLTAMLSSIKELWHTVDIIVVPFRFDQWEGHILTFVQKQCFLYESFHRDPRSPFVALKPLNVLKKFRDLYPMNVTSILVLFTVIFLILFSGTRRQR